MFSTPTLQSPFQKEQKILSDRLSSLLWQIHNAEKQYLSHTFDERRNIHIQGPKTQFLLAGIFQHCPSLNKFKKIHPTFFDASAGGPSEFCPVIDIFDDVRNAQKVYDEWLRRPQDYSIAQIRDQIAKAEKVAWNVQVLIAAMRRGGDTTPPLLEGTETLDEYCERVNDHQGMVNSLPDGYDGLWVEVPSNDTKLCSQQIINTWNGVCRLLLEKDLSLEEALKRGRAATRNMEPIELPWTGQVRTWFEWEPKLAG